MRTRKRDWNDGRRDVLGNPPCWVCSESILVCCVSGIPIYILTYISLWDIYISYISKDCLCGCGIQSVGRSRCTLLDGSYALGIRFVGFCVVAADGWSVGSGIRVSYVYIHLFHI